MGACAGAEVGSFGIQCRIQFEAEGNQQLTFVAMPDQDYLPITNQQRRLPIYISLGFTAYFALLILMNSQGVEHPLVEVILEIMTMPVLIGMGLFLLMNLWWLVKGGASGRAVYGLAILVLLCGFGLIAYATL